MFATKLTVLLGNYLPRKQVNSNGWCNVQVNVNHRRPKPGPRWGSAGTCARYSLHFGAPVSGKRTKINHRRLPERGIRVAFTLLWSASRIVIFTQTFFVLDAKRSERCSVRQLTERGEQHSNKLSGGDIGSKTFRRVRAFF